MTLGAIRDRHAGWRRLLEHDEHVAADMWRDVGVLLQLVERQTQALRNIQASADHEIEAGKPDHGEFVLYVSAQVGDALECEQ